MLLLFIKMYAIITLFFYLWCESEPWSKFFYSPILNKFFHYKIGEFERSSSTPSIELWAATPGISADGEGIGRGRRTRTDVSTTLQRLPRVAWVCHWLGRVSWWEGGLIRCHVFISLSIRVLHSTRKEGFNFTNWYHVYSIQELEISLQNNFSIEK